MINGQKSQQVIGKLHSPELLDGRYGPRSLAPYYIFCECSFGEDGLFGKSILFSETTANFALRDLKCCNVKITMIVKYRDGVILCF